MQSAGGNLPVSANSDESAASPAYPSPDRLESTTSGDEGGAPSPVKLGCLDAKSPYGTPFLERDVAGKVILITGAARGIGASLAAALCKRGAKVLIADRLQQQVESTARSLGAVDSFVYDQTDVASIRAMFDAIKLKFDHLDVLVANAGVMAGLGVDIGDTDDRLEAMNWRVNAEGCSQVVKYALPLLFSAGGDPDFGRTVIFIGSSSARLGVPDPGYGALSYRGSRAGVNGMMVALHSLYCESSEAARNLRGGRTLQRVASGDPGYVASALGDDDPKTRGLSNVTTEELMRYKQEDGAQTLEQGADTLVYLVCAESIPQNGKMYYQRKVVDF